MKHMWSCNIFFVLAISIAACTPAPTNPVVVSPAIANPSTVVAPTATEAITAPPVTDTIVPSPLPPPPTVVNGQAFTEYVNGTLWVHLFSPQDEAVVQTAQIAVAGQAPVETVISLNDEIYVVSADQSFTIPINLEEGPNVLEFVASDLSGNEVTFILTVTYEP
jgi:hypothetical protein